VESEGNQRQVFLLFPPPLEIARRFPHSHSLDDDPFFALHKLNERSPSHHLIPLGSSFDEKMLEAKDWALSIIETEARFYGDAVVAVGKLTSLENRRLLVGILNELASESDA